jgi:hypothetical protein
MTQEHLHDLEINGFQYRAYIVIGKESYVELRPYEDGREVSWGHASSLLDDHEYEYWAGGELFQKAVDTAKQIAARIGAAFVARTWTEGILERQTHRTSDGSDWRDYLNGKPVHNGDLLELETLTGWRVVRYESHKREVTLFGERTYQHQVGMKLRWLERE